jgi:hypothetical protein
VSNLNNSLSYNCLTNTNHKKPPPPPSHGPIFLSNSATTSNDVSTSYNYLSNFNQTNLRRSVFLSNGVDPNRQLIANISSCLTAPSIKSLTAAAGNHANIIKSSNSSIHLNNHQIVSSSLNDPLGHIYETISVSSNCAGGNNMRFNNNRYNNLALDNGRGAHFNPYNDLEFEFSQANQIYNENNNNNTAITNDSANSSHKSHELFLINLDSTTTTTSANGGNRMKQLVTTNKDLNQILKNQQHQQFLKYPMNSSISTNSSTSPSCSSSLTATTTATTTSGTGGHHQLQHQPVDISNNNKYLIQRLQTNQIHLSNSINRNNIDNNNIFLLNNPNFDEFGNQIMGGEMFTSRIEAVV